MGLGLIYVTQQPGAIAEEIVSQTENFLVMHLLNRGDVDALAKANRHFAEAISDFIQNEALLGYAYLYSAPRQPFVFPAHLYNFNEQDFAKSPTRQAAKTPGLDRLVDNLRSACKRYDTVDGRLASKFGLLNLLIGAQFGKEHPLVRQKEEEKGKPVLQADAILTRGVMQLLKARYNIGGQEVFDIEATDGQKLEWAWIWDEDACKAFGWTLPGPPKPQ